MKSREFRFLIIFAYHADTIAWAERGRESFSAKTEFDRFLSFAENDSRPLLLRGIAMVSQLARHYFDHPDYKKKPFVFDARWVIPIEGSPISSGSVMVFRGELVLDVCLGKITKHCRDIAVLPAFVNAHTHLEFSSLAQPLGKNGMPFTDWIRQLIAWRRARDTDEATSRVTQRAAIANGIEQSLRGGAECLGEIATSEIACQELQKAGVAGIAFWELIGLSPDRVSPLTDQARRIAANESSASFGIGISPHAPYTIHPELLGNVARISAEHQIPIAMHLAETREELELLRDRSGPFVDLLTELNAWHPNAIRLGSRPLDYLRQLSHAHRALVIHGNYLDSEEIEFLANCRDRITVVYCPRTHSYFDHEPYPLRQMLDRGVRMALGTDSRASNPDLDMLAELRFAVAKHPDVLPNELLQMATINGAYALGLENQLGSLEAKKQARIQIIELTESNRDDPYGWMY